MLVLLYFHLGRTPYWFHPGEEIHGIFHDLSEIMRATWEEFKDLGHHPESIIPESTTVQITDGFNVSVSITIHH